MILNLLLIWEEREKQLGMIKMKTNLRLNSTCPKCTIGSFHTVTYVIYKHCSGFSCYDSCPPTEHLHLECDTCGYIASASCDDAKEKK
jgi:hypothetical protein